MGTPDDYPKQRATDLSLGVERVLLLAAGDEEFKERLLAERAATIDGSGVELTGAERAILLAAPDNQLDAMIARLTPAEPERREFLKKAAKTAAAGVLLGFLGVVVEGCERATDGVRPDRPESSPVSEGVRPDRPVSRGARPDRPPPRPSPESEHFAPGGIRPD